ncbi:carboxypeptidase-like regulatory domain-containing protein [Algoriphagus boritolerans]|uniref:carboxypeptidase-like regulatory domain-containing protein n=1 Tax=Algoriphagus boritolerans TaxID=308111 RepID=UPI000B165692
MSVFLTLVFNFSFAQETQVSGKVSDLNNDPLPGATILVKGTSRGTVTDVDGMYLISAFPGDTLVFSFVVSNP